MTQQHSQFKLNFGWNFKQIVFSGSTGLVTDRQKIVFLRAYKTVVLKVGGFGSWRRGKYGGDENVITFLQ